MLFFPVGSLPVGRATQPSDIVVQCLCEWLYGVQVQASMPLRMSPRLRPGRIGAMPPPWRFPPQASLQRTGMLSRSACLVLRGQHRHTDALQKEASLPAPDPPSDSQTAAIVGQHAPYMVATYVRPPPMMVKGEGCYLWDIENRRYLDFTAGIAVNALGHCDPEMSKLIAQQVRPSHRAKR